MFNWSISWEESITDNEDKVQEGEELECSAVTNALGALAQPELEVQAQLDQVVNLTGYGFGVGGRSGHNILDDAKGGGLLSL